MAENTNYYSKKKKEASHTLTSFSDQSKEESLKMQAAQFSVHILLNLIFYMIVIIVVCKLGKAAYNFAYPIFGTPTVAASDGKDLKVTIAEGESLSSIIQDLESKKIIENGDSFRIRCKLSLTKYKTIIPGTYTLNASQSYEEILNILTGTVEENTEE